MASESITYDFTSRGADKLAADFRKTGDNAVLASRGARLCADALKAEERAAKTASDALQKAERVSALLAVTEHELDNEIDKTNRKLEEQAVAARAAGKGADGARGGFRGLAAEITGFGAAADAANSKGNKFKLALAGLNLASGVLEPAAAGLVVAAGGIAAAYASAGLGLAAFGLVAKSVLSQASSAAQKYTAAQQKFNTATTSKQRVAALQAEKTALYGLDAAQKSVVFSIIGAQNAWQGFTKAATPGVAKVLAAAIKLLPEAFALLKPFLAPVETALTGIIGAMRTGIAPGSQFSKIMHDFAAASGTTLSLALRTAGNLFLGLLGVLHSFLPEGTKILTWVEQASVKFREWGTTLSQHTGFQSLMQTFRTETPQAVAILKNLGVVLLNVGKAMFGLSTFSNSKLLLQALLPLSGILASLSKNTALTRVVLYLVAAGTAAAKLKPAFAGVKAGIEGIGVALKFASANPILIIAAAVIALGVAFAVAWHKSSGFRDFIKSIGVALLAAGIIVVKANKAIVDSFLSMVGTVLHGAADAFGWIPGLGGKLRSASKSFDNFKAGVDGAFNSMVKTMQGWQGELGASKRATDAATKAIVDDLTRAGFSATGAKQDVSAYTAAIQKNGAQSQQARNARQILIADLERSGVSAKTAKQLVDNLQRSISGMHGKTVDVGVHGSGSGGAKITVSSVGGGAFAGKLVAISNRAAGGIITGGTAGRDSVPIMAMPGEVVVPTRMVRAGAVDHLRGKLPGFAAGGLVSPSPDVFASRTEGSYGADGKGAFGAAAAAAYRAVINSVTNAVKAAATAAAGGIAGYKPGAGVAQWRGVVQQALGLAGANVAQLTDPVLYQMQTESGGNPRAVNLWDINAQRGTPSVGLMQVIAPTFRAYAGRFLNTGPFAYGVSENPLANVYSAIKYAQANYGPGLRNAYGGIGTGHGYDHGGYLPTGWSLAYNGTGRPEPVIPAGRGSGGTPVIQLEVAGSGSGTFDQFLLRWIQEHVRVRGGGSVQTAFGRR